jgi:hypothetical protein
MWNGFYDFRECAFWFVAHPFDVVVTFLVTADPDMMAFQISFPGHFFNGGDSQMMVFKHDSIITQPAI